MRSKKMYILLSILFPVLKSLATGVQNDMSSGPVIAIGLVVILVLGAGIIFLIVLAAKFLIRLRNNKAKHD
jgi:hypothetical protein